MKIFGKLFAAALMATALAIGPAAAKELRFVVVSHGQAHDPFWSVVKNGVDAAAKDMGVKVEYRAPDTFDMVAMSQLIDAAVASGPDGLVVSIPDADALGDSIKAAVAAGIPVISMNSGSDVRKKLGAVAATESAETAEVESVEAKSPEPESPEPEKPEAESPAPVAAEAEATGDTSN